ncbi:hypothetical protein TNCT_263751 [Trichonephila clavata]|uniref:Uncharacterized protein n=1 Tax=Trichonephila clavata TaxID=2740835 RepID=A0A8X6KXR9_TRICU|nr:hypothetical protein TNCT_263751 [Trichonephila clavata]
MRETDRSNGEGSRAAQGEAEGSESLAWEENTKVEQFRAAANEIHKPCLEGQILTHCAVEGESTQNKRCPEDQVLTHCKVEGNSTKEKRYQEGRPYLTRVQGGGETSKSRRSRFRAYKRFRGKGTTKDGFASEEERIFTLEQFERLPSQRSESVEDLRDDSTERP